jgi:hypothetical protein
MTMTPKFKLITSNSLDLFEERLNGFTDNLAADDMIVDIKFSTTALHTTVEYSALVQYQQTETWGQGD